MCKVIHIVEKGLVTTKALLSGDQRLQGFEQCDPTVKYPPLDIRCRLIVDLFLFFQNKFAYDESKKRGLPGGAKPPKPSPPAQKLKLATPATERPGQHKAK